MTARRDSRRHSSQSETKLAQLLDPHVICFICKSRYSIPKVLPCLHSFCQHCLERCVGPARGCRMVIQCPKCNSKSDLPESGVNGYSTNYPLGNIVEALNIHDAEEELAATSIFCDNGLVECEREAAVVYCTHGDCCCYLCKSCMMQHQRMKATRNHKLVTLNEVQKDFRKLERKHLCVEHQEEELKLYCRTCQEVICRDCTIVTHKQHDYTFIKDVREELVREMKRLVSCADEKDKEFLSHQQHLNSVETKSKENLEACSGKVRNYFKEWRRRLDEREQQLLSQLNQQYKLASKQVDTERSTVDLSKGQITSAIEFTRSLLRDGAQYDIAMMSRQTCKQLKHVQTFSWNPGNVSPCDVSFIDNKESPVAAALHITQRVRPDQIIVKRLSNPVPGINRFTIEALKEDAGEAAVPIVKIENGDGVKVPVNYSKTSHSVDYYCWNFSYEIAEQEDTRYRISVYLNGVEAIGSPFERHWIKQLKQRMRVRRGRDWKYGNQDGGLGKTGVVINCLGSKPLVRWDETGQSHSYRWGENKCYDIEITE